MESCDVDNSQFLFIVFGLSFVAASAIVVIADWRWRRE